MNIPRKRRAPLLAPAACALAIALVTLGLVRLRSAAPKVERRGLWIGAVQHCEMKTKRVWSVGFSPDGRWLASGSVEKTERLWDAAPGHERRALSRRTRSVWSVAFSLDGGSFASCFWHETVRSWDTATAHELRHARAGQSPGGGSATPGSSGSVRFREANPGSGHRLPEQPPAFRGFPLSSRWYAAR